MKTLNETFTEEEFKQLQEAKGKQSWHDFILQLTKGKHGE
jgi:predicted CopG family antitoxin